MGTRRVIQVIFSTAMLVPALSGQKQYALPGRWDITIATPHASYPGWMEIAKNGNHLELRVQPRAGSVKPVTDFKLDGTHLAFVVSTASAKGPEVAWEMSLAGDRLIGIEKRGGTEAGKLSGVRAPALKPAPPNA